ncbi:MAG TPA: class I SAM-dependent methyltransferase, partial [Phenylobacterium sp.]|nr:class I SAM-dependent methyltransferase [Phenylobacterium sp.]
MASLYDRFILPKLLACACSSPPVMKQRAKVVPQAAGQVLELGIGLGLNLSFYDPDKVTGVTGVDPAAGLRAAALAAPRDPRLAVTVEDGTAEALPFEDRSFDTVVCTFTLCSVHTPQAALAEARRVLKPAGAFLFCEH